MEFEFITDISSFTELEVLVLIYNLILMMSIYRVTFDGFKVITSLLKKGGKNFK